MCSARHETVCRTGPTQHLNKVKDHSSLFFQNRSDRITAYSQTCSDWQLLVWHHLTMAIEVNVDVNEVGRASPSEARLWWVMDVECRSISKVQIRRAALDVAGQVRSKTKKSLLVNRLRRCPPETKL